MTHRVYIAGGVRTPFGAFNGAFSEVPATVLGSMTVRAALSRTGADLKTVEEVYFGNILSAGLGQNVARQVGLGAGLPVTCGGMTVNKMCGSAMRAVRLAAQAVECGDAEVMVAGGTENMTRAPYLLMKARTGYRMGHGELIDSMILDGLTDAYENKHMGSFAERLVRKYNLTREQQDEFAITSFKRLAAAQQAGYVNDEIVPVEVKTRHGTTVVDRDETGAMFNEEKLRKLRPAFEPDGTITAGNASSIADGAAAMLVMNEPRYEALPARGGARILGYADVAVEPQWFTIAPIHAIQKLCKQLSLKPSQVDLFEINEAFAAVVLAAMKELDLPHDKVNVFGGAVALGHPIGTSGARILVTLCNALRIRKGRIGIATACIGGGEAAAMAIERVD